MIFAAVAAVATYAVLRINAILRINAEIGDLSESTIAYISVEVAKLIGSGPGQDPDLDDWFDARLDAQLDGRLNKWYKGVENKWGRRKRTRKVS